MSALHNSTNFLSSGLPSICSTEYPQILSEQKSRSLTEHGLREFTLGVRERSNCNRLGVKKINAILQLSSGSAWNNESWSLDAARSGLSTSLRQRPALEKRARRANVPLPARPLRLRASLATGATTQNFHIKKRKNICKLNRG